MTELSDEELAGKIVALIKRQAAEGFTPESEEDPELNQVSAMIEERLNKPGFLALLVRLANEAGFKLKPEDIAEAYRDVAAGQRRLH